MSSEWARSHCRDRLTRLADSAQDCDSLRREVIVELKRAIGFDRWCAPLIDPDTLIAHTGIGETDHLADMPVLQLHDASLHEVNNGIGLARGHDRAACLSERTGGDLARSKRWERSLNRYGTGDELRFVVADERGCWGRFDLWRDRGDRPFSADDVALVRTASVSIARALRAATVRSRKNGPTAPREAGILLIGPDLEPRGGTPAIWSWFRALNTARVPYVGGIPSLVWAVVGRRIAIEHGEEPERPARIRARAEDGTWAVIEAARLDDSHGTLAVSIHAAGLDDGLSVTSRAYGLTRRECDLVKLVVQGLETHAIASQLCVSHYTVQDHLKSIFDKMAVHSRLEIVSTILGAST